jgi:uncharacterized protein
MASQPAPPPTVTSPIAPTAAPERIAALDVLRGFALFGILLVNMQFFAMPFWGMFLGLKPEGAADRAAALAIRFFAEGKFYTLFSFLFGLGFSIILMRTVARGGRPGRLYARRLLALLLIGLVHAFLIWMGDILVMYAATGFLLLLFRNLKPKNVLRWAVAMLLLVPLINFTLVGFVEMGRAAGRGAEIEKSFAEQAAEFRRLYDEAMRVYPTGSFREVTQQRITDVTFGWSYAFFFVPSILGMFLMGLYAGKRGIFQDLGVHLPLVRRVQVGGLVLGLAGNALFTYAMEHANPAVPSLLGALGSLGAAVGHPALSLFYASTLVLLAQRAQWQRRLAPMAALGRMALSNYLLQSLVATTIFYSHGLGLFGQVGPARGVLLVLAIYFAQMPLSVWWLGRFQFGPAEWLWRSLTYKKLQPMRLPAAA